MCKTSQPPLPLGGSGPPFSDEHDPILGTPLFPLAASEVSDSLTDDRHYEGMKNNAGQGKGRLAEIRRLAEERNKAWDDARAKSRELYEAIEASGISPTKIAANAPISRGAIYSLKNQMTK